MSTQSMVQNQQNPLFQWDDGETKKTSVYYGDDEVIKRERERKAMGLVKPAEAEKAAENTMLMQIVFIAVALIAAAFTYSYFMNRQTGYLRTEQLRKCAAVVTTNLTHGYDFVADASCTADSVKISVFPDKWTALSSQERRAFLKEVQGEITGDYGKFPLLRRHGTEVAVSVYAGDVSEAGIDKNGSINVK